MPRSKEIADNARRITMECSKRCFSHQIGDNLENVERMEAAENSITQLSFLEQNCTDRCIEKLILVREECDKKFMGEF